MAGKWLPEGGPLSVIVQPASSEAIYLLTYSMCERPLPHSSATMATMPSLLCWTDIPETVSRNKSFLPQVVSARFHHSRENVP